MYSCMESEITDLGMNTTVLSIPLASHDANRESKLRNIGSPLSTYQVRREE